LVAHARARVSAWVTNAPPPYCVVDLTGGSNASAYAVSYYASAAALPYGGLTNALYKSSYLVLRKIACGAFSMGDGVPSAAVTLTQDFYAGLFEVTQGQWCNVMGTALSAYSTGSVGRGYRPMEQVSYSDIRGASAQGGGDWPSSANVAADSFVGRLRARTGISGFDLPTEAQWEYACRAGTSTCFSDGIAAANVSGANADSNAWLDALGRYWYNGGNTYGTAIVGTYRPNAWGLYDVHGNVWEWCLDWYADPLTGGTDPKGAATGTWRVERGGGWESHASSCAAISRYGDVPSYRYRSVGFRIFRTLP
jgi:formylglycine-generating enzyme required for sulfatase activity